jgi:hypothetical protein
MNNNTIEKLKAFRDKERNLKEAVEQYKEDRDAVRECLVITAKDQSLRTEEENLKLLSLKDQYPSHFDEESREYLSEQQASQYSSVERQQLGALFNYLKGETRAYTNLHAKHITDNMDLVKILGKFNNEIGKQRASGLTDDEIRTNIHNLASMSEDSQNKGKGPADHYINQSQGPSNNPHQSQVLPSNQVQYDPNQTQHNFNQVQYNYNQNQSTYNPTQSQVPFNVNQSQVPSNNSYQGEISSNNPNQGQIQYTYNQKQFTINRVSDNNNPNNNTDQSQGSSNKGKGPSDFIDSLPYDYNPFDDMGND